VTRSKFRTRRYGLRKLWCFAAVIAYLAVGFLLLDLAGLSTNAAEVVLKLGAVPLVMGLWIVDTRLERRQRASDLERARAAIRQPLRNAVFANQDPIDFDPQFPTVWPGGGIVSAIDPKRRTLSFIVCTLVDKDGVAMRDGGRVDGKVVNITRTIVPPGRRWFGLLPPSPAVKGNVELSASIVDGYGKQGNWTMKFRPDDHAAEDWRLVFEQWAYEDRVS
jgi:hypothetical protein